MLFYNCLHLNELVYLLGVASPRMATDGNFLPSARQVSLAIHKDTDRPHAHLMALTAIWGEFVAQDIAHTPQIAGFESSAIKCCGVTFENFHTDCFPIRIEEQDKFYAKIGGNCQEYMRSSVAPRIGCTLGPREQINQASSFLDASTLYGISRKKVDELRLFQDGLLRTQVGPGGELLPSNSNSRSCRSNSGNFRYFFTASFLYMSNRNILSKNKLYLKFRCFKAGDDRINEHVALTTLHTLWLREHNRVARGLHAVNPHWSDEMLFQEARKIVGAEVQHITYNEFLPVVLGQSVVISYGLEPQQSGFYKGYDINTNSGVLNGVASAALWFFASLMPKTMPFYDSVIILLPICHHTFVFLCPLK